ncbi:hypothetical protein E4U24_002370, partial [Claviceps purpurea]
MINDFRDHMIRVCPARQARMEPGYRSATADDDSYVADGSADTTTVQSSKRKASSAPDGAPSAKRSKRKTAGKSTPNAHSTREESENPAPAHEKQ